MGSFLSNPAPPCVERQIPSENSYALPPPWEIALPHPDEDYTLVNNDGSLKAFRFCDGNYQMVDVLGRGGYGVVVKVKDHENTHFALKLGKTTEESFYTEIAIYSLMNGHPGFPTFYNFTTENEVKILVLELMGMTLSDYSLEAGHSPKKEICHLGLQMLNAIEALHKAGYVHCDVKLENFVFGLGDKAKKLHILDFGISKGYLDIDGSHVKNKWGKSQGTVKYMSSHTHKGYVNARRDDLESLVYCLMMLKKGTLPWASNLERINHSELGNDKIKFCTKQLEREDKMLYDLWMVAHNTEFEQEPDYSKMRELLQLPGNEQWEKRWMRKMSEKKYHEIKLTAHQKKMVLLFEEKTPSDE